MRIALPLLLTAATLALAACHKADDTGNGATLSPPLAPISVTTPMPMPSSGGIMPMTHNYNMMQGPL